MSLDTTLPLLIRCIDNRFIQRSPSEVTHFRQVIEQIIELGGLIISCTGRIPFIPINLKAVKGGFGIVLVVGNLGGHALINSWSYLRLFEEFRITSSEEERALLKKSPHSRFKPIILISSIVIGALSQLRSALLAYRYNENSIGMALWILVADSSIPVYSTKLSLEKGLLFCMHNETERALEKIKKLICELLEMKRALFAQMPSDERSHLFKNIKCLTQEKDTGRRVTNYLELIFEGVEVNMLALSPAQNCEKISIQFVGGNLSLAQMISYGLVSYQGGKLLLCSPIAGGVMATTVVGANIYLNGSLIIKTCLDVSRAIKSYFQQKEPTSITTQLRPKLSYLIRIAGFTVAAFAWGPSVQVNRDYAQGSLSTYLQICVSTAITTFIMHSVLGLSDLIVSKLIRKRGEEEEKEILQQDLDLQKIIDLLQKCSTSDFASFILYLPERLKSALLRRHSLSEEMILAYFLNKNGSAETSPLLEFV